MITTTEAGTLIRNKQQFHQQLRAIKWHLPALKSDICKMQFLHDVRNGKVFCMKVNDVRLVPCVNPPPNVSDTVKIVTL